MIDTFYNLSQDIPLPILHLNKRHKRQINSIKQQIIHIAIILV